MALERQSRSMGQREVKRSHFTASSRETARLACAQGDTFTARDTWGRGQRPSPRLTQELMGQREISIAY